MSTPIALTTVGRLSGCAAVWLRRTDCAEIVLKTMPSFDKQPQTTTINSRAASPDNFATWRRSSDAAWTCEKRPERFPCPPLIPDAEKRRGIRTYLTKKPRVARGFFHFLAMPPFRSPNDGSIRFDTFCYRQPSLSGTWYGTNVGTFRRFSAP
jgi:hypothetical protein